MQQQQDLIKELLKESIKEYIDSSDFRKIVEETIKKVIKEEVIEKEETEIKKYIKTKIKEEIDNAISKDIDINDGWGNKKHYDNFEEFFKASFYEKLNTTWEMKRTIQDCVREKMSELFDKRTKEVTAKIQDLVLEEMISESQKKK